MSCGSSEQKGGPVALASLGGLLQMQTLTRGPLIRNHTLASFPGDVWSITWRSATWSTDSQLGSTLESLEETFKNPSAQAVPPEPLNQGPR